MNPLHLLSARFRGFRVLNLLALTVLLVIALGSYALKTFAGAQDAGAAGIEDQIVQEQRRVRMLKAEIARLGAPQRVADLSRQYLGLAPGDAKHDIAAEALPAAVSAANAAAPAARTAAP
jgi:hypothetical protein